MEKFIKGDVVVIPFPFSDLSDAKRRPALVVTTLEGDDVILCQITSQTIKDKYSIQLNDLEFESGRLHQNSNIRPNRLFTADINIILNKIGKIKNHKITNVVEKIIEIVRS